MGAEYFSICQYLVSRFSYFMAEIHIFAYNVLKDVSTFGGFVNDFEVWSFDLVKDLHPYHHTAGSHSVYLKYLPSLPLPIRTLTEVFEYDRLCGISL